MEKYNLTQTGEEVQQILDNATPQSELSAEVERAQGAEQALQGHIDNEELRAKAAEHDLEQADTVLQGHIDDEELRAKAAEQQNADDIEAIESIIPNGASSSNKLADKEFVNSSIATNTAQYHGSFNQINDLHLTLEATQAEIATALASVIATANNNDYCYVQVPVSVDKPTEIAQVDRYKFNGTSWAYEYTLNNSGFTSVQWAAINSAITSGLVAKLVALPSMAELTTLLAGKQNVLSFDTTPTTGSPNPVTSGGVKSAIESEKERAQAAEQNNNNLITGVLAKIPSEATSENKLVDKSYVDTADASMQSAIEGILALIPQAATPLNQLADKAFVNSSIATNTGTFKGTYNVVLDLELFYDADHAQIALMLGSKITSPKNNDYCYVQVPNSNEDPTSINHTDRYKFNGSVWAYEYTLNNSGYTAAQWGAINSGITSALVTALTNLLNNLVPSTATAQNKLADQAYVIAAIVAAIPACKGTFTTLSDLEVVASPKAGDLGIVRTTDSNGYAVYTFYQYLNNAWTVFFEINHFNLNKPASANTSIDLIDNGMGKYEIPKHIVNIGTEVEPVYQNQLYQSDFQANGAARTNTIYVIRYDYTLAEDITIPANCILEFDGGSISGERTITGNNTGIQAGLVKILGTDITLAGTWNVTEAYPEWFGAKDDGTDDSLSFQNACNLANTVVANNNYVIDNSIYLRSNQHLIFKGSVCLHSKDSGTYLFIASDKPNIVIEGGYFYSTRDKDGTPPADHTRENLKSSNWFFISKNDTNYSNGAITIRNVKTINLEYFSIRHTSNIIIDNCVFENALMAIFIDQSNIINISNCKITLATELGSGDHAIYIANSTIININNTEANCPDNYCEGIIDIWYFNDGRENILPNNILISNCKLSGKNCLNLCGKLESALILGCELVSDSGGCLYKGGGVLDDTMNLKFQDCIIQVSTLMANIFAIKNNRVSFSNCSIHTRSLTQNGGEDNNIRYSFSHCNIKNDDGTNGFIKIVKSLSWEFIVDNCKYVGGGNRNYFISVYNPGKFHIANSEFTNQNLLIDNNSSQAPTTFHVVNSIISWNYALIAGLTANVVPVFFNCIDKNGNIIYGSGATRPINPKVGQQFFDTTSGIEKPIWYKGNNVWVDATGTEV